MSDRSAFNSATPIEGSFECDIFSETEPRSGAWNMAIDAAMLERCLETGRCHLRLYRWSAPTLSLGYFQKDDSAIPAHLSGLPCVRRLSGGGAILHHREWTYSCTVPAGHPLAQNAVRLYDVIHECIISVLLEAGWKCRLRGDNDSATSPGPFLCFARGDSRDVLFGEHKVVGSAQRRRKGAVLQHGSLLLSRSEFAPEFPGLFDLASDADVPDSVAFQQRLTEALSAPLGRPIRHQALLEEIRFRAAEIGGFG